MAASRWVLFKTKLIQLFGSLIMEKNDEMWSLSMGRVAFWIMFVLISKTVYSGQDIGANTLSIIMFLLIYNLGKKGLVIWDKVKNTPPANEGEK